MATTDTRGINIEKFITYKSWRKCLAHLEGPCAEVKAEQAKRGRHWGTFLLESAGGVLWGSWG